MKYKSEFKNGFTNLEAVAWRCSVKKLFLKISQNSQENTCTRVLFKIRLWRLQPYVPATLCHFIKPT